LAESFKTVPEPPSYRGRLERSDTREVLAAYDPARTEPAGGHRIALSFACAGTAAVDPFAPLRAR
jgi:hypothetical protein